MNARWHPRIEAHEIKPATLEMFRNQLNTVLPELDTFKNPSRPKAAVKATL